MFSDLHDVLVALWWQLTRTVISAYRVELRAQANFSAPTFEPAHEARAGQRAALSVQLSQLQLRCSTSISGLQASSPRSELSAKRAAKNVFAFCQTDRNLSNKSFARYFQSKKRTSKVVRRSWKKKKKTARSTCRGRSRPPPSIDRRAPQPGLLQASFQSCRVWFL